MPSKPKSAKKRLDLLVVERGLAESREKAQAMILAGEVRVNGERSDKAGAQIAEDARIEVSGTSAKYASRGGLKLEGALEDFGIDVAGKSASISARPPEASPIACCSMARAAFTRST